MIIIGSQALLSHLSNIPRRPKDYDIIGTFDELGSLTYILRKSCSSVKSVPLSQNKTVLFADDMIIEFELAWNDTAARDLWNDVSSSKKVTIFMGGCVLNVPTLDQLYTLKMSHRYLKNSPHFRKTRDDIMLMRQYGAKVFDEAWLKKREKETYTYNHPKLNVMKKDFFAGDGVEYVYDHDTIHQAMAHYCPKFDPWGWKIDDLVKGGHLRPAYTLYMKEGEEVKSDRSKFFELPEHIRLWGVLEEAYVLALERSQIPFRGKVEPRRSFDMALMKVCTSITSGWFREFAWENLDKVEALYDEGYVDRFWKAVDVGLVRKL